MRTIRDPEDVYDTQRSGLWARQASLPKTSEQLARESTFEVDEEEETESALKAVSVRELAAWIDTHIRLRPDAPETAELFPEVAAAVLRSSMPDIDGYSPKPLKVIYITFEHQLVDEVKEKGARVYGPKSWVRADGKAGSKECASSVAGIVIAGRARGEAFNVCIAKKTCQVHYKAEIAEANKREADVNKSGKTGAERAALEKAKKEQAEKKAKEAQERFVRAIPAIQVALAEKIKTAPIAKLQASLEAELKWQFQNGRSAALKLLPAGKTAEAWMRFATLALIVGPMSDTKWVRQDDVASDVKAFGVDVAAIIASANENDAATKAARKKPAKGKGSK